MIKSITVTNYLNESLKITLDDPFPDHGLIIQNISGLGAATAIINTTELATNDGTIYNSARLQQRNITISMFFVESPNVEDARQRTYKYFPIKKRVELTFETDNRILKVSGYTETNEPDIFSSAESNQISIICPDPFFYSAEGSGTQITAFYGIEPVFEFAFENESLNWRTIELSSIENETEKIVYYEGDSEVGITITIHAIGPASNITIYNARTREVMKIDTSIIEKITGSGIVALDDIIITTSRGEKGIKLLRNGRYYDIFNCLARGSDWFTLTKGDNLFAYTAETGSENLQFVIENKITYEGV